MRRDYLPIKAGNANQVSSLPPPPLSLPRSLAFSHLHVLTHRQGGGAPRPEAVVVLNPAPLLHVNINDKRHVVLDDFTILLGENGIVLFANRGKKVARQKEEVNR